MIVPINLRKDDFFADVLNSTPCADASRYRAQSLAKVKIYPLVVLPSKKRQINNSVYLFYG